jgi:hypothetical protein
LREPRSAMLGMTSLPLGPKGFFLGGLVIRRPLAAVLLVSLQYDQRWHCKVGSIEADIL